MKRTLVLSMLFAAATAALPANADPAGVFTIDAVSPATAPCDAPFTVTGRMQALGATGVPQMTLVVVLDEMDVAYASTELDGTFTASVDAPFPGSFMLTVRNQRGRAIETSSTPTAITIAGDCPV